MKPKVAFINKAAEEGRITQQEKEFMLNHPRMRWFLSSLQPHLKGNPA